AALARCSTRVTHDAVRQRVRRLLAIFQGVCQWAELDLSSLSGEIIYHRLNDHYRDAHELAWLLLDGLGTKDLLLGGKTTCFAFLIDMNRLFEKFVFCVLNLLLAPRFRVHYQRGDSSIIIDAETNRPYARVIPDILVEQNATEMPTGCIAVDAKYKLYDDRK